MAKLKNWSQRTDEWQQETHEKSDFKSMFLKQKEIQDNRDMLLTRGLQSLNSKLDSLIKDNEVLTEQVKTLRSELNNINSPLNKLFGWIKCKLTKK